MDDGACDHLARDPYNRLPAVELPCTDGTRINLAALSGPTVLFFYPRTGVPGQPPNRGFHDEVWDSIPGARGCTPQSCSFRDRHADFAALGVRVLGVSTNTTAHQCEFKSRQHIPFEFLSDSELNLTRALALPTFEFPVESGGPNTLLRRFSLFADRGRIVKVWYPVFPPADNAARVLHWIRARDEAHRSHAITPITLRDIEPRDLTWVRDELARHWGGSQICSLGRWYDADRLPGFIAIAADGVTRIGLLTHTTPEPRGGCEVITLSSSVEDDGVGMHLLDAAVRRARTAGCARIFLTTTNDNLRAIGFYRKRGWRVAALHRGAMDHAREIKPSIPPIGLNGIPLRDELELEMRLDGRPSPVDSQEHTS